MLDGLFVTPVVTAIAEALASARAEGRIAVVGNAKLARSLGAAGRDVVAVGLSARAKKKIAGAVDDLSALDARSLAAVIGVDVTGDAAWNATLHSWSHAVRDGGVIVMVDRGHAAVASRRALCAGMTELEQRHAGRVVVTSGFVTHLLEP